MQYAAPVSPVWLEVSNAQRTTIQRVQPGNSMVFVAVSEAPPVGHGSTVAEAYLLNADSPYWHEDLTGTGLRAYIQAAGVSSINVNVATR
jgi:hypothetical protein